MISTLVRLLFKLLFVKNKVSRLLLFFCFLISPFLFGQEVVSTNFVGKERKFGSEFLGKDLFDSNYWLDGTILRKVKGLSKKDFQEPTLGKIQSVDFVNPMQIAVFYSDFNALVLLDRELTVINQFSFSELLPSYKLIFVGTSIKNRFWIVDEVSKSVAWFSPTQHKINTLYRFLNEEVTAYFSDVNNLYWVTETGYLKAINIYGKNVLEYYLPKYDALFVVNLHSFLYRLNGELYYVDIKQNKTYRLDLPLKSTSGFFFNTQKLSIFAQNKLSNFTIKLP